MTHSLPPLAYAYDALEPHVDAATMEIHHARHHQAYVNGLNTALEGTEWSDVPVEWLLTRLHDLPPALHTAVRNHGGGHANHTLFWSVMSPRGGGEPTPFIATAIARDLGGWAAFKEAFTKAALARFGSGWAWLSVVAGGGLVVESTANQDSPLMEGRTPILGLDVWEHAYYLKHQNRRPDYIAAFFNVVDWNEVERRYAAAMA